MTTPNDIVTHLQTYLQIFTDTFCTKLTVASASSALGNVISVNSVAHGLTTGRKVITSSGTVRNQVNNVVVNGDGTATITTDYDHDLVTPKYNLDQDTITLTGFTPSEWNYEATIIEKIDGTNLKISTSETLPPTVTGYFPGTRSMGGIKVVTVIDADNFTYTISGIPQIPVGTIDGLTVTKGFKIFSAATIQRAEQVYTKELAGEDVLFVIMGDLDISRDRHTMNDAIATFTAQDENQLTTMQNFETVVFVNTADDIAASNAIQRCYGEIWRALLPVFYGFGFESPEQRIKYLTVTAGHGPGIYNRAYYQHVYSWQAPEMISFRSGFAANIGPVTTAFREIAQTWDLNDDEKAQLEATTKLR